MLDVSKRESFFGGILSPFDSPRCRAVAVGGERGPVAVKAAEPDDARFKVFVSGDQFQQPIQEDEATHLY
jgi:hypothetical protein